MKKLPIPANEASRLETLHSYGVLDTLPEQAFEDLTTLASQICGTSIAAVSLIDENRQWFKSIKGVDARETSREISFCGHAILDHSLFEVSDATKDERFVGNPFVTGELNIRFYAGAPLVTTEGHSLGTLCVLDAVAKTLSESQKAALEALARQVVNQFELRRANHRLESALEEARAHAALIEEQRLQLQHASKMKAIGEMAGGIAHEINNPLAILCAKTELLSEQLQSAEFDRKLTLQTVAKIQQTSRRIAKTVKSLLGVLRAEEQGPFLAVTAEELFSESVALSKERFKNAGVELIVNSPLEKFEIQCNREQVSQVILNLLNNAFDAVAKSEVRWVKLSARKFQDSAEIYVSDSGPGVAPEHRERIMEPFFTTKAPGKGTGLGLSVSKSLLDWQNGTLSLDTKAITTTFTIRLPLAMVTPSAFTSSEKTDKDVSAV